ncbi:transcriptional regulator [Methylococcaceae bacterium WWC4]|nr:transcriptional regulator [Methylococcaceae bacterium WWC4]
MLGLSKHVIRTAEPKPIASRLHDYLEIARLYGYYVKVAPRNGRVLEGNGVDTVTIADKREVLLLDTDGIEALTLAKLEMPTPGATFTDQAF